MPLFDLEGLIENSRPQPRAVLFHLVVGGFVMFGVMVWMTLQGVAGAPGAAPVLVLGLLLGLMAVLWFMGRTLLQRQRIEMAQLETIEEMMQLRRWPEAAMLLVGLLMQPMRTHGGRVQGLIFLSAVLARMHQFDEVIRLDDQLLREVQLDDVTLHAIKAGRAMAMLRQDHLFDADRAIGDLRRDKAAGESAILALVELYRDVKTGHAAEAVELFNAKKTLIRNQLGHRLADAYALLAKAHDFMGQSDLARESFAKATLLSPIWELQRRYPEVTSLAAKYAPHPAPPEVA